MSAAFVCPRHRRRQPVATMPWSPARAAADKLYFRHDAMTASHSEQDLEICAREPIHRPGAIQPHGALLVLDSQTFAVLGASANAADWLGKAASGITEHADAAGLVSELRNWTGSDQPACEWRGEIEGRSLQALAHHSGEVVVLEFEAAPSEGKETLEARFPRLRAFAETIPAAEDLPALLGEVARFVREVTGFDRVLVYQFDEDWNGKVEGENGNGILPSYLGLRFPASDIPAQARQLYTLNRVRIIPTARYEPVPIESFSERVGPGLDLSFSLLRSVSPIHLEYMRNMGTGASMSVSILIDGQLWGLVACHSAEPHLVPLQLRNVCDFAVQLAASEIASRRRSADAAERLAIGQIHARLLAAMAGTPHWAMGLRDNPQSLLGLVKAGGAAIISTDEPMLRIGTTPDQADIEDIVAWLEANAESEPVFTDSLVREMPGAERFSGVASGLLAIRISELHTSWVLWFRPELRRTVLWGGEPHKHVREEGRIHPRQSFAAWQQQVEGVSQQWSPAERDAALNLRSAIVGIVLRRAEEVAELAQELQRSNKELEAFSYSVSHDLRAPFRHIVGYAELLRERETDLDPKSQHYLESIGEAARSAGQLVDDLLNFSHIGRTSLEARPIDMNKLVREVRHSLEFKLEGREIEWDVRPLIDGWGDSTLLRQVWFNLIENAIKYTGPRQPARISISATKKPGETIYHVKDNGVGFDMAYKDKLFGVFQRLQRAEDFEGTGIGLALARRIVERHGGQIWADGEVDVGAEFHFSLPLKDGETDRV
jgi:chemotaxis family two-component system sensor kinase Cph1